MLHAPMRAMLLRLRMLPGLPACPPARALKTDAHWHPSAHRGLALRRLRSHTGLTGSLLQLHAMTCLFDTQL